LSGLSTAVGRARRVQWQVHVQPARLTRGVVCHAAVPRPDHVSQLLSAGRALAVQRRAPGPGCDMKGSFAVSEPVGSINSATGSFLADVLNGLRKPARELPCKYFYDAEGSRLFDEICELEE